MVNKHLIRQSLEKTVCQKKQMQLKAFFNFDTDSDRVEIRWRDILELYLPLDHSQIGKYRQILSVLMNEKVIDCKKGFIIKDENEQILNPIYGERFTWYFTTEEYAKDYSEQVYPNNKIEIEQLDFKDCRVL